MADKGKKADKAEKAPGIGDVAVASILEGKTNEQVLADVKKAFPDAKTGMSSVNWYRNKLRSEGAKLKGSSKVVPTSRELAAAAKKATEATAKKAAKEGKATDPLA